MRVVSEDGKGCAACGVRGSGSTGTRGRELLSAACRGAGEASGRRMPGGRRTGLVPARSRRAVGRGAAGRRHSGVTAASPRAGRGCYSDAEDAGAERSRRDGARTW